MPASGKTPIWDWNIGAWFAKIAVIGLFVLGITALGYGVFFAEGVEANEVGVVYDKDDGSIVRTADPGVLHLYNPLTEGFETYDRQATITDRDITLTENARRIQFTYRITYTNPPASSVGYVDQYASASRFAEIHSACARTQVREATANYTVRTLYENTSILQDAPKSCEEDPYGAGSVRIQVTNIHFPELTVNTTTDDTF